MGANYKNSLSIAYADYTVVHVVQKNPKSNKKPETENYLITFLKAYLNARMLSNEP